MEIKSIADAAVAFRTGERLEAEGSFDFAAERANRPPRFVEIINAYERGVSVDKIVDDFKCSRGTVLRYARMAGLPKRPKHFPLRVRTQVIDFYRAGKSGREIADLLSVSEAYVSIVIRDAGIERKRQPFNVAEILAACARGVSRDEVAKAFGCSRATVQRHIRTAGLQRKGVPSAVKRGQPVTTAE